MEEKREKETNKRLYLFNHSIFFSFFFCWRII